jgi:aspartate aminotransferase
MSMHDPAAESMDSDPIIDIGKGEPSFHTPFHIKKAAHTAIDENFTKYTPQPGIPELREAIARKFKTENGIDTTPENIVVSCGGKHSVENAIRAVVKPSDEVIITRPYWFAYPEQVRLSGGVPVFVDVLEEDGFVPDRDRIRAALTERTKLLILNTPSNPTTAVYPRDVLMEIAKIACESDLTILSDEVYEKLVFDGNTHVSIASLDTETANRTITVNSVSKTHAMTGWRIGYASFPGDLAQRVVEIQQVSTSAPCAVSQKAALAAFTGDQSHISVWNEVYNERRAFLLGRLAEIPFFEALPPAGTFYSFVHIGSLLGRVIRGRRIETSGDFADLVMTEARVKVVSGESFGSQDYIRVSFAVKLEAIKEGLARIDQLLHEC